MPRTFLLLVALLVALAPASAHRGETHGGDEQTVAAETSAPVDPGTPSTDAAPAAPESVQAESIDDAPFTERLGNWLGRFHPAIVHFPLALVPLAFASAILARRRERFLVTTRFLLVVAGVGAALSAILGWLLAVPSWWDADPVMAWHRWVGTLSALLVAFAGWIGWGHPDKVAGSTMRWGLAGLTLLMIAQGWLGGSLVHGTDHLAW